MARTTQTQKLSLALAASILVLAPALGAMAAPPPKAAGHGDRIGLRQAFQQARQEFQVYRGDRLERWTNRLAVGRSDFNKKLSVKGNLESLVKEKNLPHYYAEVGGKQVLHVVVDLAQGKKTKAALRSVMRRVGDQTIELNYKAATPKNTYGHVAVRAGNGALYDLTGTQGVAKLPKLLERLVQTLRGTTNLSFARKRSLRRFMESRTDSPHATASVYYGMLFAAAPEQVKGTQGVYNERLKNIKEFSVGGGDAAKGVFSCAQFLTEGVPFLNERGIGRNIGARSTASAAHTSSQLEAVVVYKMPSVTQDQLLQFR